MILQAFKIFSCAFLAAASISHADQVLYMQSCGACHGADGQGVGGQFPALAKSEWVQGDAERMIQLVLHGIAGPIKVKGKEYNLAMPPQGMAFTDEKLAGLLTYVRSNFGNKETKVTPEQVMAARAKSKDRSKPWTAAELAKIYPLPKPESMLKNLVASAYFGEWKNLPTDLKDKEPNAVEEEHSGLMDVRKVQRKDNYAMVFFGDLDIPKDGDYEFLVDADDAAEMFINGKKVVSIDGKGPMNGSRLKKKKVSLKAGLNDFSLTYWEATGNEGLSVQVKGPDVLPNTYLTVTRSKKKQRTWPKIPVVPTDGRAALYRNFISGSSARAIGVGYHEGVNLAFSADSFNVEQVWQKAFIDGGRHWTNRGQGAEPPAGENVISLVRGPAYAVLDDPSSTWPKKYPKDLNARFHGYKLIGVSEIPEFSYEVAGVKIRDFVEPSANGLSRKVTFGGTIEKTLYLRVVSECRIEKKVAEGVYLCEDGLQISISGSSDITVLNDNRLIVGIKTPGVYEIVYNWK